MTGRPSRLRQVAAASAGAVLLSAALNTLAWLPVGAPSAADAQRVADDLLGGRVVQDSGLAALSDDLGQDERRGSFDPPVERAEVLRRAADTGWDLEGETGGRATFVRDGLIAQVEDRGQLDVRVTVPLHVRVAIAAGLLLGGAAGVLRSRRRQVMRPGPSWRRALAAGSLPATAPVAVVAVVLVGLPSPPGDAFDVLGLALGWLLFGIFLWLPVGVVLAVVAHLVRHRYERRRGVSPAPAAPSPP